MHTLRSVTVTVTVARLMKLDLLVRRSGRGRGGDDEVETRYEDEMDMIHAMCVGHVISKQYEISAP